MRPSFAKLAAVLAGVVVLVLPGVLFVREWSFNKLVGENDPPSMGEPIGLQPGQPPLVRGVTTPAHQNVSPPLIRGIQPAPTRSFDTDNDGLLDWEEALWGTDATRADSDGDETPDGEEVARNRDPRKQGPDDSFGTPSVPAGRKIAVLMKQPLPSPTQAPPLIRGIHPSAPPIAGTGTAAESSLRTWGNAVGALITATLADADAELAFWNSAVGDTKMNAELLQGFRRLAKKYERLAADIAAVVAEDAVAETHRAFASAYQGYADAVRAFAQTPNDSHLAATDLTAYSERTLALGRAFIALSDFFNAHGIRFGSDEPGQVFMFPR